MEIAVRKATRLEYQAPKAKHITTLINLTFSDPASVSSIFHELEKRHREASWIITFKVLVIAHTLLRQGSGDHALAYMAKNPTVINTSRLSKSNERVALENIEMYKHYLEHRIFLYQTFGNDPIKSTMANKVSKLRYLTVAKGLLRETRELQKSIDACLQCRFSFDGCASAITFHAFRLLIEDLLVAFQAINEGTMNILEHYFEMSAYDAEEALAIYKRFAEQTKKTTAYLGVARKVESELGIQIPDLKHAPLSLVSALEEHLRQPKSSSSPPVHKNVSSEPPRQKQTLASTPAPTQPPVVSQPSATVDLLGLFDHGQACGPTALSSPSFSSPPAAINTTGTISSNPFRTHTPQTSGYGGAVVPFQSVPSPLSSSQTSPYSSLARSSTNPFRTDVNDARNWPSIYPVHYPQNHNPFAR